MQLERCPSKTNSTKKSHSFDQESVQFTNLNRSYLKIKGYLFLLFIALLTISFPTTTFGQLPDMGAATNFVLFTNVGALGNTGVSNITGNIGTGNGAITGFGAPSTLNGNIDSGNVVTAQCAIDVQAAFNQLYSMTPTELSHAPAFGNGETLLTGVYYIGGAGSIAANLTLDADGDPNAIFVFQFAGAFTTGAASTINLINGTSACNVFWVAEGAIAMAANTDMKGTLISNNGAVSMGAGGILEGRLLSTTGAASVYNVLINQAPCSVITLPIKLLNFSASCINQKSVVEWSTATEINNDYFTIEQSIDGNNWSEIGKVIGAGNSTSTLHYKLIDPTPQKGMNYYRLKQTDFNGSSNYEGKIGLHLCERTSLSYFNISPNPSKGKINLNFKGNNSLVNTIDIFNAIGQHVYSTIGFKSSFDLSDNDPGFYYMRIQQNTEITSIKFKLIN